MKCSHKTLIFLSGFTWILIGTLLLSLGIHFILDSLRFNDVSNASSQFSILTFFEHFVSNRTNAVILVVTASLMIGYFKGKMVLSKSVDRQIKRIKSFPNPTSLKNLYGKGYYILIAIMVMLGISLRFWPITLDTRGAIDLSIGSALINGAMLFFRVLSKQMYLEKRGDSVL